MNKILKQVSTDNEQIVTVCAWCCPGESIFELYPQLKFAGVKISHGICPEHKAQMLAAINSLPGKQGSV